jgi:hypothetical protein
MEAAIIVSHTPCPKVEATDAGENQLLASRSNRVCNRRDKDGGKRV